MTPRFPYPDAATLIADTGHPNFPGWELIAVLLMAATISLLIASDLQAALRRRADRGTPRTTITQPANAVRQIARRAA